jgi:putative photosynthetic complex assembly protein 2
MVEHGLSFVFTVLLWWLSTALVLWLCALPKQTFGRSLFGASILLLVACYGLLHSAWTTSVFAAYVSFLSALVIWGWLEMSFLMGIVTGPRTLPCPADATGWRRFTLALGTLLYHELAILTVAASLVLLTWGAPNQTGTLAFLILMAMRISAKLNIFLGVPNLTEEFLPERLAYLKSYFRTRAWNWLFPLSVLGSTGLAILLARRALAAEGGAAVGPALLCTLVALAILEHFFMIVPLPDATLWRWAVPVTADKPIERPLPDLTQPS